MIAFGSILTTFESNNIFVGSWGSIENWLEPKVEPSSGNLACPNPLNALYIYGITLKSLNSKLNFYLTT